MADVAWPQVVASVLGGGAVGAIITTIVTSYRNRRQPVGSRIDIVPVFQASLGAGSLRASIIIDDGGRTATFGNLFLAQIYIVNLGNRDFSKFEFGFTLENGDLAAFVEPATLDRFHKVTIPEKPTPTVPLQNVDATLEPFNRGDSYWFKLYLVTADGSRSPGPIGLASPEAVVFTRMPTLSELAEEATLSIRLGPFRIVLLD